MCLALPTLHENGFILVNLHVHNPIRIMTSANAYAYTVASFAGNATQLIPYTS